MIVGPNNRQLTRSIEGVDMHTPPEQAIEDGGLIWIDVSEKWAAIWMGWDGQDRQATLADLRRRRRARVGG